MKPPSVERFKRKSISDLHAYAEEHVGGLNFANNANLFGTNPAIARALQEIRAEELWNYPSLTSVDLRAEAGRVLDVDPEGIVTGNGSNELIDVMMRAFCEPGDRVAFHDPTFSMIPIFARVNGAAPIAVPLGDDWSLDADALAAVDAKLTFVVSPNNPTGNAFPREDILKVVENSPGVVVVDEAYGEFGDASDSFLDAIPDHANLVVLRTLSKAFGLAGFRIGFLASNPALADEVAKVRGPFKLNAVSERAAVHALRDTSFVEATAAAVMRERPYLADALRARGFTVYPSIANFLFVRPPVDAAALTEALGRQGVHVRDFKGPLAEYLRITVGPRPLIDRLVAALDIALPEVRAG